LLCNLKAQGVISSEAQSDVQAAFDEAADYSLYGLINAVTQVAHRLRKSDGWTRAFQIERLGGEVLRGDHNLPAGTWLAFEQSNVSRNGCCKRDSMAHQSLEKSAGDVEVSSVYPGRRRSFAELASSCPGLLSSARSGQRVQAAHAAVDAARVATSGAA
jgi:hypothetical protein